MIFFNIYGKTATKLTIFLMFIFVCFVAYGLIAQKEWTCNCFGKLFTQKINYLTLIRNIIILGIAMLVNLKFNEQFTYDKLKYKNIILALIIIINLIPFLYHKLFPQMSSLKIGDKIELNSKSVDKKDVDLSDRTEPYAILFVFSLDDCTSCLEEALYWEKLKNKFQSKIKLFAIAYSRNFLLLKSFINHKGITFPIIWDREKDIIKSWNVTTPVKILIDNNSRVINISKSLGSEEIFKDYITFLIRAIQ